jgi:hypothetical protein
MTISPHCKNILIKARTWALIVAVLVVVRITPTYTAFWDGSAYEVYPSEEILNLKSLRIDEQGEIKEVRGGYVFVASKRK